MTLFMMAMHLGNGIGPVVLGTIADWLALESAFYTAAIFMACGVVLFACLVRGSSASLQSDSRLQTELSEAQTK